MGTSVWPSPVYSGGPGRTPGRPNERTTIWDRIRTGVDRLFGPGPELPLSDPERAYARRQGLITAGASLLSAEGMPFLPALGQAIPAAREASMGAAGQARGMQREQMRNQIMQKYAGRSDPQSLLGMFQDLVAVGDYDGARPIAEILKSMGGGAEGMQIREGIDPVTKQPGMFRIGREGAATPIPGVTPTSEVTRENLEAQRMSARRNQLRDEYRAETGRWIIPFTAMQRAEAFSEEAGKGNTAAQLQLLYAFINTLDNSVVREGEAAMFLRAAPYIEQAKAWINKIRGQGAVMAPGQVREVTDILEEVNAAFETRFDSIRKHYTSLSGIEGVSPDIFMDIPKTYRFPGRRRAPTGDIRSIMRPPGR